MKTIEQLEQERYELRIISAELQRQESFELLKQKHFVSGSIEEQKQTVSEKSEAIEVEIASILAAPVEVEPQPLTE